MKKIISISLGNSKRDSKITAVLHKTEFEIQRIGTNGSIPKMRELFEALDGKADAFGLGGIDFHIYAGQNKKIPFPIVSKIIKGIKTPVYDGSLLKLTLEPMVIRYLQDSGTIDFSGKKAFCLSGSERYGMALALNQVCREVVFGDLLASLELPIPIRSIKKLEKLAGFLGPLVVRLPFSWLYPTGDKQLERKTSLYRYFFEADVIAGDFHYIYKYAPNNLSGKIVITNTMTEENIRMLQERGTDTLISTTPSLNNRTFGTNVIEAMLAVLLNKNAPVLSDFVSIIRELKLQEQKPLFNSQQ